MATLTKDTVLDLAEGSELVDKDDGQKRYVIAVEPTYVQLTGYPGFCRCESWYEPEEVAARFESTGRVVEEKDMEEGTVTECDCGDEDIMCSEL